MSKNILIVGAGIAGLALAHQLQKFNIPFKIIEKRNHLLPDGAGIALPANAVKALRYIGLGAKIDQDTHQVAKIIYTDILGNILSEASLLEAPLNLDRFVALHRSKLHDILQEDCKKIIQFGTSIDSLEQTQDGVVVRYESKTEEEFSAVIGADGINSSVRQLVFPDTPPADIGITTWRWTCQHETTNLQPTYMLGARDAFMIYPISDNEVYCYAHLVDPENKHATSADHQAALMKQFGQYGGLSQLMLARLPDNQFIIQGRLQSVAQPVFTSGCVALVGDASHACTPMLQQGAAGALEDVIALSEFLKHFPTQDALSHYKTFRSERVNWVTTASDGPLKMLAFADEKILPVIYQKIREGGPSNVQGWKQLLATNPLDELSAYIKAHNSGTQAVFKSAN